MELSNITHRKANTSQESEEENFNYNNKAWLGSEDLKEFIGTYEQTYEWMRWNKYIISGYRINFNTFLKAFKTLFMIHNETLNIWTHLIGAAILICLGYETLTQIQLEYYDPSPNGVTRWPLFIFLISGVVCMSFSFTFHWFYCCSHDVSSTLHRLDYSGIVFLIYGSTIPAYSYIYYCKPFYMVLYIALITIVGVALFILCMTPYLYKKENTKIRVVLFVLMGAVGFVPAIHAVNLSLNVAATNDNVNIIPLLLTYYFGLAVCYLGGVSFYATKFPECKHPGKFDIVGQSHQIWHIFVLGGLACTYYGSIKNFQLRVERGCIA